MLSVAVDQQGMLIIREVQTDVEIADDKLAHPDHKICEMSSLKHFENADKSVLCAVDIWTGPIQRNHR